MHLIGGGARSPAYRQILADLSARDPGADADETVATGGAVQAAAMLGRSFADTATAWDLGAGIDIGPS